MIITCKQHKKCLIKSGTISDCMFKYPIEFSCFNKMQHAKHITKDSLRFCVKEYKCLEYIAIYGQYIDCIAKIIIIEDN